MLQIQTASRSNNSHMVRATRPRASILLSVRVAMHQTQSSACNLNSNINSQRWRSWSSIAVKTVNGKSLSESRPELLARPTPGTKVVVARARRMEESEEHEVSRNKTHSIDWTIVCFSAVSQVHRATSARPPTPARDS